MNAVPKSAKSFRLSVRGVIFDNNGHCLLLRRSAINHNFVGCWEWPGGQVDSGEDFAAALLREVHEETSFIVQITGLAGAVTYEMATVYMALLCMEVSAVSGKLQLSEEHDDFSWVPLPQFSEFSFPPNVRAFMLEYAKRKMTL